MSKQLSFLQNNELTTIKKNWQGNRIIDGCFVNQQFRKRPGFGNVLKWRFSPNPQRKEKRREKWNPEVCHLTQLPERNQDALVWLGHNSFFVQIAGKRVMFDPVFGNIPFVKRQSRFPANPEIFLGIDYLLLSHDHFDHMDKRSIVTLYRNNPGIKVFCGLKTGELLQKWCPGICVIEAGWYQQLEEQGIEITFLPAQHWGKRSVKDGGLRLWGAFMLRSKTLSLYYSGDTGYADHFSEVKKLFGAPDYALIGIGAYKPRWFMQPNHISPYEALAASRDMNAGLTIPMHYGTFDLSDEPLSDPPKVFAEEADRQNINITIPALGELISLHKQNTKDSEAATQSALQEPLPHYA